MIIIAVALGNVAAVAVLRSNQKQAGPVWKIPAANAAAHCIALAVIKKPISPHHFICKVVLLCKILF